jgi:hypothetical protein
LESAQEQWEKLTTTLKEAIYWIDCQDKEILNAQPVGGDLAEVSAQVWLTQCPIHNTRK